MEDWKSCERQFDSGSGQLEKYLGSLASLCEPPEGLLLLAQMVSVGLVALASIWLGFRTDGLPRFSSHWPGQILDKELRILSPLSLAVLIVLSSLRISKLLAFPSKITQKCLWEFFASLCEPPEGLLLLAQLASVALVALASI